MSESRTTADQSPSPSVIRRVEELCDDFEAALKTGASPDLQTYLDRIAVPDRPKLLVELEALILAYHPHVEVASTPCASDTSASTQPAPPANDEKALLPDRVGKHKILGRLGEGAMGIVYRAHHPVLNRDVALKTIRPQRACRRGETERVLAEARHVAKLDHPHVVAIYDADEDGGLPYFTMALVEGGTLHSRLADFQFGIPVRNEKGKSDGLSTVGWSRKQIHSRRAKVLAMAEKVCRAVHAAHAHVPTIIHRDLKPGNILLDGDEPRVSDFGLAKSAATDDGEPISDQGYSGTPPYMSPEQHRGESKNILATSDVWAIGVILYELVTGRRPFLGKTREEIKRAVLDGEPPRPREVNPQIDLDLEAVILKCLEKDVGRRYQTAADLADDLVRCRSGIPLPIRPVGRPERLWRWARRQPALAGLVGLMTVTLVTAIVLLIIFSNVESRREREAKIKSAKDAFDNGIALCKQGDAAKGILWMARGHDLAPADATELRQEIRRSISEWYAQIYPLESYIDTHSRVLAVAFRPNGRTFLTGNADGTAQLRDTATGGIVGKPFPHPAEVLAVAISGDGARILTGCRDGRARLWDSDSGILVHPPLGNRGQPIFAVGISPDGDTLFTGGGDGVVNIWNAHTGKHNGMLRRYEDMVMAITISSDGKTIVTGTSDRFARFGTARRWNVAKGDLDNEPLPHLGPVLAVAFSPDGKSIVTGSQTEAFHWELAQPMGPRLVRYRHGAQVRSVAVSRDGNTILTGSNDRTARLWDLASGNSLGSPLHHAETIRSVAFSPDTDHAIILTGSEDGSARLWKFPTRLDRFPDNVILWAQVITGMELDKEGTIRPLSAKVWHERRTLLDELKAIPSQ